MRFPCTWGCGATSVDSWSYKWGGSMGIIWGLTRCKLWKLTRFNAKQYFIRYNRSFGCSIVYHGFGFSISRFLGFLGIWFLAYLCKRKHESCWVNYKKLQISFMPHNRLESSIIQQFQAYNHIYLNTHECLNALSAQSILTWYFICLIIYYLLILTSGPIHCKC